MFSSHEECLQAATLGPSMSPLQNAVEVERGRDSLDHKEDLSYIVVHDYVPNSVCNEKGSY